MRKTTISSDSPASLVQFKPNVLDADGNGVRSQVFSYTVPKGVKANIYNEANVRGQTRKGFPIVLDLNDTNGDRISGASRLTFGYMGPSDEFEQFMRSVSYSTWRGLTTAEQRNEDYRAALTDALDLGVGKGLTLREGYTLMILIESPQVIDPERSHIAFEVEEVN